MTLKHKNLMMLSAVLTCIGCAGVDLKKLESDVLARTKDALVVLQVDHEGKRYHGTGVAVSSDGLVLTAFHNIASIYGGSPRYESYRRARRTWAQNKTLSQSNEIPVTMIYHNEVVDRIELVSASAADDLLLLRIPKLTPSFLKLHPWREAVSSERKNLWSLGLGNSKINKLEGTTNIELIPRQGEIVAMSYSYEKGHPEKESLVRNKNYGGHVLFSNIPIEQGDSGGPWVDGGGLLVGISAIMFPGSVFRALASPVCQEQIRSLQDAPGIHWALQIQRDQGREVLFFPVELPEGE